MTISQRFSHYMKQSAQVLSHHLKLFILSIVGVGFLLSPMAAYANYPAALWWNGDQCDVTHYTSVNTGDTPVLFTTWSGVQACGYGLGQSPYNWPNVSETIP